MAETQNTSGQIVNADANTTGAEAEEKKVADEKLTAEDFKRSDNLTRKKLQNLGITVTTATPDTSSSSNSGGPGVSNNNSSNNSGNSSNTNGTDGSNKVEEDTGIYIDSDNWGAIDEATNMLSEAASENVFKYYGKSLNGIFGCPYQFNSIVDPDIADDTSASAMVGRKYSEKILANAPILFLSVGDPEFMAGSSKAKKKSMVAQMAQRLNPINHDFDDDINDELFSNGRFYSFTPNMVDYFNYVQTAARALAILMGIGDRVVPGTGMKLSSLKMEKLVDPKFKKFAGSVYSVPFFVEAETSISESFSNSTTQSIMDGVVEQGSQFARQAKFLLGSHDIGGLTSALKDSVDNLTDSIGDAAGSILENFGSILAGRGIVSKLKNEFTTITSGGKMIFPEIWDSSGFSRSYSITMKLRSPDPDPYSIFMNIYLPILMWVSAAAPHQLNNTANSYEAPFIVRATYKSIFSCDAGIISNLSISKASEDKWNAMGMPISVDLNIDIKDLYNTMFISKSQGIINNTAQLDYLALMAGVDMNDVDARRSLTLITSIYANKPMDIFNNFVSRGRQNINNVVRGTLRGLFNANY